jgi:carboxyl-terminal processing protease
VQQLEKNVNKQYSLNIKQYEADQKQLKSVYKQLEEAYKLPKPLDVKNLVSDTVEIAKTKEKIDGNKKFVKRVGEDIYIDESVRILNRMIVNDKVARKN